MSSPARRSLRTTAAAAGIAALGLGFAGQALAAPALPAMPALPGADGLGDAGLPAAPALPSEDGFFMPGVANIEMPAITTAAPELPAGDAFAVPTAPELAAPGAPNFASPEFAAPDLGGAESLPSVPEAPATDGMMDTDFDVEHGEDATAPTGSDATAQNTDSAMAGLDMASSVMELLQGAAADGPSTQDNELG